MKNLKRKILIAADWKSNGTIALTKEIINEMINTLEIDKEHLEIVISPTFLHLAVAVGIIDETKASICA